MRLTIEKLVFEGHGLARDNGRVLFVDGALPGETVEAEIVREAKRHAFARVTRILIPSPLRRTPACPAFGACGGCHLLDCDYAGQCAAKEGFVREALRLLPGVADTIRPIWASPEETDFRNKMSFSIRSQPPPPVVGLHRRGEPDALVSAEHCRLPSEGTRQIVRAVEAALAGLGAPAAAAVRMEVRESRRTGERMAVFVFSGKSAGVAEALASAAAPGCTAVICTEPGGSRVMKGDGFIRERMDRFVFRIGPDTFFQTHTGQAERLFRALRDDIAAHPPEIAVDLYAGVGVIACFLAEAAGRVIAVESEAASVRAAAANFAAHGLGHVRAVQADAARWADPVLRRAGVVVVDPPRAGLAPAAIRRLIEARPPRLHYISCHPATLARDLRLLIAGGFAVRTVQPLDLFPQTFHVETWVALEHPVSRLSAGTKKAMVDERKINAHERT